MLLLVIHADGLEIGGGSEIEPGRVQNICPNFNLPHVSRTCLGSIVLECLQAVRAQVHVPQCYKRPQHWGNAVVNE